ncbi:MAG: nucleoside hydrolase-like domain-containing protein [Verrucomicrobiota bacterium]
MNPWSVFGMVGFAFAGTAMDYAPKPKVWIYSDAADKSLERAPGKRITDPDDISAMANYLLMSNHFETVGIVVGGNRNANCDQRKISMQAWAEGLFLKAYMKDLPSLNENIGGFQDSIRFLESFIWRKPEPYDPGKAYLDLKGYESVELLVDALESSDGTIYVLCWGMLTEPAILIRHCVEAGRLDLLEKVCIISHWTSSFYHVGSLENPDHVHNAFNDAAAAAYVKESSLNGLVRFYECAAVGQSGIVGGSPRGWDFYKQFRVSELGRLYVSGKYLNREKTVDDSDSATHWVLLGDWGVGLEDINDNGVNTPSIEKRNEESFFEWSPKIRRELLRRVEVTAAPY